MVLTLTTSLKTFNSIAATHALAYYGLTLIKAKRAVEEVMDAGIIVLKLPVVDDPAAMESGLAALGLSVRTRQTQTLDLARLRAAIGMTQEQFALTYGFELRTLQKWESTGRLDRGVASYLRLIEKHPHELRKLANDSL